jgi:hypothetical protein
VTLPEDVIEALGRVDADLSRAIVRVAPPAARRAAHPPAELARFGRHAVIVVDPSRTLERRAGVELVPLPDGRALISFDRARTTADLELTIADALEDQALSGRDRQVFEGIARILKSARQSQDIVLRQRNIIVLEGRRRPRRAAPAPRRVRARAGRSAPDPKTVQKKEKPQ